MYTECVYACVYRVCDQCVRVMCNVIVRVYMQREREREGGREREVETETERGTAGDSS